MDERANVNSERSLSTTRNASRSALGNWQPYAFVQVLPRCPTCEAPHPLALDPPQADGTCPACGGSSALAGPVEEVALDLVHADAQFVAHVKSVLGG